MTKTHVNIEHMSDVNGESFYLSQENMGMNAIIEVSKTGPSSRPYPYTLRINNISIPLDIGGIKNLIHALTEIL